MLRASSLMIRRRQQLGHITRSYNRLKETFQNTNGRRRRRSFSDFSRRNQSSRIAAQQKKDLERFTIYALNSHIVPLGTMTNELWEETVVAINSWLRIGGGFALDSAGRLVERLNAEHAIQNPITATFKQKSNNLLDLHNSLLHLWLETCSKYPHSNLALLKADSAFQRRVAWDADFPIDEMIILLESWLRLETDEASRNAAKLLLYATDYNKNFSDIIGPYFERISTILSRSNDKDDVYLNLQERIDLLRESENWTIYDSIETEAILEERGEVKVDAMNKSEPDYEDLKQRLLNTLFGVNDIFELATNIADFVAIHKNDLSVSFFEKFFQEVDVETLNPKSLVAILKVLGDDLPGVDLHIYQYVIQALFRFKKSPLEEIHDVFSLALRRVQKESNLVGAFGEFLFSVLAMHTYRNLYVQAGHCLLEAEKELLSENPCKGKISVIPLKCYERMIIRKWYTKKTAPWVQETFQRLMRWYRSGYSNLLPNTSILAANIRANATLTNDASRVESTLEEIIMIHEESGDDSCKPNADIFNTVLLAYKQDSSMKSSLAEKSMHLFHRMEGLEVVPDTKSLNFVIQSVNKGFESKAYPIVCDLFQKFDEYGLEPDKFSRHGMLDACGSVEAKDRDIALKTALEMLGGIREHNHVGPLTYKILTKVLKQTLSKGPTSDKVSIQTFRLCCEDGFLESKVKSAFKSLMSKSAWDQAYTKNLRTDGQEPPEWRQRETKR